MKMRAGGDLDQLSETISDLSDRERAKEREVQEGLCWSVVRTETVLVLRVIDCCLDADRGVNQPNECGWDTNERRVPAINGAGESANVRNKPAANYEYWLLSKG